VSSETDSLSITFDTAPASNFSPAINPQRQVAYMEALKDISLKISGIVK
jgi:hypothetical protein